MVCGFSWNITDQVERVVGDDLEVASQMNIIMVSVFSLWLVQDVLKLFLVFSVSKFCVGLRFISWPSQVCWFDLLRSDCLHQQNVFSELCVYARTRACECAYVRVLMVEVLSMVRLFEKWTTWLPSSILCKNLDHLPNAYKEVRSLTLNFLRVDQWMSLVIINWCLANWAHTVEV